MRDAGEVGCVPIPFHGTVLLSHHLPGAAWSIDGSLPYRATRVEEGSNAGGARSLRCGMGNPGQRGCHRASWGDLPACE